VNQDRPLIYVGFGSAGTAETDVIQRLIAALGKLPYRVFVSVGPYESAYTELPDNVQVTAWCNQIGLLPHCDVVIQHGGNNTLSETLYFGKPPIVMPFAWDGHENAARVADTQHGVALPRYSWTEEQLSQAIETVLFDPVIRRNLERTSRHMQAHDGCAKAASLIERLLLSL
jgi:MGT family glycosyltransferase